MVLSSTVFSCNRFDGAAEAKESLLVAKGGHEEQQRNDEVGVEVVTLE